MVLSVLLFAGSSLEFPLFSQTGRTTRCLFRIQTLAETEMRPSRIYPWIYHQVISRSVTLDIVRDNWSNPGAYIVAAPVLI